MSARGSACSSALQHKSTTMSRWSVLQLAGIAADVLSIPATIVASSSSSTTAAAAKSQHFVILPGNPGVAQFYEQFAHDVHRELRGAYHVHCVSYAGHQLNARERGQTGDADARLHGLLDQAPHHLAFLNHLCQSATAGGASTAAPPRIVLFGHSIGASVALQMMRQRPDLDVAHVFCGFPFLRFDLTRTQERLFHLLFFLAPLVNVLLRAIGWCAPPRVVRAVARACGAPADESLLAVAARLPQHAATTARNILHLGSDEFARMPRARFVEDELQVHKAAQISYFWARNDRWAPEHQLRDLCALLATGSDASSAPLSPPSSSVPRPLPPSVHVFEASVSHAFCTERTSCALVAQQCRAVLEARALL